MNFTRDAVTAAELSVADRVLLFCLASGNGGAIAVVRRPPNGSLRPIAVIYMAAAFFRLLPIAMSCSSGGSGQTPRLGPQYANERTMFAIDWLRRGVPVLREMSLEPTVENAMAAAQARAAMIRIQLQDREPDTFRVVDAGGLIVGHSSFRRAGRHS